LADLAADAALRKLLECGVLCNDATLKRERDRWVVEGDPTEGALVVAAVRAGLDVGAVRTRWPRVAEVAFTSERKKMSTLHAALETDLTFLGFAGMMDAPRADAIEAIRRCKKAGIRVVMITGDHKLTAMAIAREMGILEEGEIALTGEELEKLSDEELLRQVERIRVYARVAPEHKMRIVDAWKKAGHIVAMTGDGVNDAPALKRANLGVAMGIT